MLSRHQHRQHPVERPAQHPDRGEGRKRDQRRQAEAIR